MRSRVQVSLPLPTKNQALASTQVLFFYPFPDSSPNSHPLCSALQRHRFIAFHRPTCKKIAKNQPYASARHLCGSLWREPLWALCGHFCGSCWRSLCSKPFGEFLGSLCGHLCGRNKKPVLEGRVPHTNINNTNNAMAEFSAFCFRYKGRTKRIMRQSPQLSIFVRVNSPDLGSKPPRYR